MIFEKFQEILADLVVRPLRDRLPVPHMADSPNVTLYTVNYEILGSREVSEVQSASSVCWLC